MSITTLAAAKQHLRVIGADEDTLIQRHIDAAELAAAQWIGANLYADAGALSTAVAAVPGTLTAATTAYDAAVTAAQALATEAEQIIALGAADSTYSKALVNARMTHSGLVINSLIESAILLIVGALYADREAGDIPQAARNLMQPFKVYG